LPPTRAQITLVAALTAFSLSAPPPAHGQKPGKTSKDTTRDTSFAMAITAGESDWEPERRALLKRLEMNLGFTTLHIGGGVLVDYAMYQQDSASRVQFPDLPSIGKFRDGRILFGGKFKTERAFTWQVGVMYDVPTSKWLVRQSGFMVAVPEIWSHFFIGRAKEGFSLNKVMTGYDGWTMERLPFTDATVPLLADGIKWLGYIPDKHIFWNLGGFTDWLSAGQTFSTYNHQFVARVGWDPMEADTVGTLLHLAANYRIGSVHGDSLLLRSRPEAFTAPYFITTGRFPASSAWEAGPEAYFRTGPLLVGTEYYWLKARSPETRNPWFYGGQFVLTWVTTGETRAYNPVGSYFISVRPEKTVIQGGPGAWETVLSVTYSNLTNSTVQGGIFWRFTPMINWYLTDNLRLEFAYGYGSLQQPGLLGRTMFFQSRIQFEL
jgi:phosphate-selective porin OprO/OprP